MHLRWTLTTGVEEHEKYDSNDDKVGPLDIGTTAQYYSVPKRYINNNVIITLNVINYMSLSMSSRFQKLHHDIEYY